MPAADPGIPLVDCLRALGGEAWSGAVRIHPRKGAGAIYFSEGRIVHAEYGTLTGEFAYWQLVGLGEVTVELDGQAAAERRSILRRLLPSLPGPRAPIDVAALQEPAESAAPRWAAHGSAARLPARRIPDAIEDPDAVEGFSLEHGDPLRDFVAYPSMSRGPDPRRARAAARLRAVEEPVPPRGEARRRSRRAPVARQLGLVAFGVVAGVAIGAFRGAAVDIESGAARGADCGVGARPEPPQSSSAAPQSEEAGREPGAGAPQASVTPTQEPVAAPTSNAPTPQPSAPPASRSARADPSLEAAVDSSLLRRPGDRAPALIESPRPRSPDPNAAPTPHIVLRLLVDRRGRVLRAAVSHPRAELANFERAALRIAQEYRFKPARSGGRTVPAWISVPVRFR